MIVQKFYDHASFEQYYLHGDFATHRAFEQALLDKHAEQDSFKWGGVCKGCDAHSRFLIDKEFGGVDTEQGWQPNWRERILCQCNLNNRQRAIIHAVKDTIRTRCESSDEPLTLYATEQVTSVFQWLVNYFKSFENVTCIGSEYLGENIEGGTLQDGLVKNIRHEDLENLSFADSSVDIIMSNDVLEHVNQPQKALQEIYRILKPKGELFLSIPFYLNAKHTICRAKIRDGKLEHYLAPEYHGNPISDEGSLVFNDFGWDFLQQLRNVGFSDVCLCHYWSKLYGYLGEPQYYIWAHKAR
ncbi:class I SAM-dependent methyltransferase [Candidatus Albibeggiatoa sp. nov. NOAA]|uniref:class I SAM-dependent methyltransferase n=1 Tax=Candidatus Albibeggiatoa sp. nov. NOAA TaxID=3162724 RepID=UPI0032F6C7D6|nr:class I SAM-dependent methyltransferase [Thiotrichaceae bacterium]